MGSLSRKMKTVRRRRKNRCNFSFFSFFFFYFSLTLFSPDTPLFIGRVEEEQATPLRTSNCHQDDNGENERERGRKGEKEIRIKPFT